MFTSARARIRQTLCSSAAWFQVAHVCPATLSRARPVHPVDEAEEHAALDDGRRINYPPRRGILRLRSAHCSVSLSWPARCTSTCCGGGQVLCQKPASEPFPPISAGEMPVVKEAGARKETTGYNTIPQPHALFLQCFRSFSLPDYSINRIAKPASVP